MKCEHHEIEMQSDKSYALELWNSKQWKENERKGRAVIGHYMQCPNHTELVELCEKRMVENNTVPIGTTFATQRGAIWRVDTLDVERAELPIDFIHDTVSIRAYQRVTLVVKPLFKRKMKLHLQRNNRTDTRFIR